MDKNQKKITAYCLAWHTTTSGAMHNILIDVFAPYIKIEQFAWDGKETLPPPQPGELLIFFQMPPTEEWLQQYDNPIVWIPMADSLYYPPSIRNRKSVSVVAFSKAVVNLSLSLNLTYMQFTYYCNPALFEPASFDNQRVLLYWNRTGLFQKRFLLKLCQELKVDKLIFRAVLDPYIPQNRAYTLPERVGDMVIESHYSLTSYAEYLTLLKQANMFIAPRRLEGVGVAFLEAMASGCCVIAYDEVTMNEYIRHGENGLIFGVVTPLPRWLWHMYRFMYRILNKISWELRHKETRYVRMPPHVSNWKSIRQMDVAQLGANARQEMQTGYASWIASIPDYIRFVLGDDFLPQ